MAPMVGRRFLAGGALCVSLACSFDAGDLSEDEGSTSSNASGSTTNSSPPDPSDDGATGAATGGAASATTGGPATTSASTGDAPEGSDGCCDAHDAPGCNEAEVQQCVCLAEQACCLFDWGPACAQRAQTECGATCEADDSGSTGSTGGSESSESSDSGPSNCEPSTFEIVPSEATLSGNWVLSMSEVGEGEILVLDGGVDGEARFEVDIPCSDTWFIWVRYWENGQDDSYFVTLDDGPNPPAIFEGDCSPGGGGYAWQLLNYRDPLDGGPCEYLEDPWAPSWDAGAHTVAFSYRESIAMGRLVVTNDPDYVP